MAPFSGARGIGAAFGRDLKECGSGYRAPYLKGAAKMVAEGFSLRLFVRCLTGEAKKSCRPLPE